MNTQHWIHVCDFDELLPGGGVCALVDSQQVAIFRVGADVYAIDNFDPASAANVLSRGLVGDLDGEPVVASPLYKQHFSLRTGACLEDEQYNVRSWPVERRDGGIWVASSQPAERSFDKTRRRLVVIGNGMAGMRVVDELLRIAPDFYDITVFGAEPYGNYNRILLSPVLAGEKQPEDIVTHSLDWYRQHGVTLHAGDAVVAIDRRRREVTSQCGRTAGYDRLLLATGSQPFVPAIPGVELPGVVSFRDLGDVDAMLRAARTYRHATVIGGGLLGLEAASGLHKRGMQVTVVHLGSTLMERQLDDVAARLLQESLRERGIDFLMSTQTSAVLGDERVRAVRFADGTELATDLIVMAAGTRPRIDLARSAGVRCERGVLVDDTLQTYDPCIYAVGECVQHRNATYGLVAPLWEQARVCALHLAELGVSYYRGTLPATQLKVTGIELFSAGDYLGSARSESLVLRDVKRGVYKRLIVEDDKVRGAVLYGDAREGAWYVDLISKGEDIGAMRATLLLGDAGGGAA